LEQQQQAPPAAAATPFTEKQQVTACNFILLFVILPCCLQSLVQFYCIVAAVNLMSVAMSGVKA
jgi:hypothetical protein